MLKSLRLRLSLLYLAAALGLVTLLGAGTYGLLALYFQRSTDLALQYKMALEFRARALSLPSELVSAEKVWLQGNGQTVPSTDNGVSGTTSSGESDDDGEGKYSSRSGEADDRYNSDLAPVFVLPSGGAIAEPGVPLVNDSGAISSALASGSDLRTVTLDNGSHLRLLTYNVGGGNVLQVGRLLADQDRLLSQYLVSLFLLGGIASLLLALMSWGLAGRSIIPVQRAWDQQQQFISNASHELRTPLTLLRASADYALRSPSAEERNRSLCDILGEVDYMNRMVEDLLLLSRIDARQLALASETVSVPDLLTETARQVEKVAEGRGVSLVLEAASGSVRGDPVRLRQVLLILLDNALRFTPAGGSIRLGSQVRGKWISMIVSDSGAGIPAAHLPRVFERFYQVPSQTGETRGNGLGLSIAKTLVEAQNGRISISSSPGRGTTVTVHFPLK